MPLVSVIVRTCRRPWFLARALRSLDAQTHGEFEVVVVDDGGGEDLSAPLGAWSTAHHALKLVRHESPRGRGAAMNAGIAAASGEWVAALDDDDTWAPEFLREMLAAALRNNLRAVVCRTTVIDEATHPSGWIEIERHGFNPGLIHVRLQDLVLANRFTNNALLVARATAVEVGPVREDLAVLEDWEFNVRLAAHCAVGVVPAELAFYHRRTATGTAANTALEQHLAAATALKEEWLREDLRTGRFGIGFLAQLAEVESNRGLRAANRLASWFGA